MPLAPKPPLERYFRIVQCSLLLLQRDFCFYSALGWFVWEPGSTSFFHHLLQAAQDASFSPWPGLTPTFLPNLLYSLQQALKSPQVSSSHHQQVRAQKDFFSYFLLYWLPLALQLLVWEFRPSALWCLFLHGGLLLPASSALAPNLLPAPWRSGARKEARQSLQRSPRLSPASTPPSRLRNARFDWTNNCN